MPEFKAIDPEAYFDHSKAMVAQKTATISAKAAVEGEQISTIMKDGLVETKNIAKAGDMIVTNPGGERYIVPGSKFANKYLPTETPGVFKPNAGPVNVMALTEDVQFKAPWGEDMKIAKGGVLVRNGPGDIYGIQPAEFKETYSVLKHANVPAAAGVAEKTATSVANEASGATKTAATIGSEASTLGKVGQVAGKLAVPVTVAVGAVTAGYQISKGDYKGASETLGGTAGAMAAGTVGAELGATVGTAILPVVGTAIGGVIGGVAGGVAGYYGGSKVAEAAYDSARDAAKDGYHKIRDVVADGAIGVKGVLTNVYNSVAPITERPVAASPAVNQISAEAKSRLNSVPVPVM